MNGHKHVFRNVYTNQYFHYQQCLCRQRWIEVQPGTHHAPRERVHEASRGNLGWLQPRPPSESYEIGDRLAERHL